MPIFASSPSLPSPPARSSLFGFKAPTAPASKDPKTFVPLSNLNKTLDFRTACSSTGVSSMRWNLSFALVELISARVSNLGWKRYSKAKTEKVQTDHRLIVSFQTGSLSGGEKRRGRALPSTSQMFKVSSLRRGRHPAAPLTSRNLSKWGSSWGGAAHQPNAPTESDCRRGFSSLFMITIREN